MHPASSATGWVRAEPHIELQTIEVDNREEVFCCVRDPKVADVVPGIGII